MKKLLTGLLLLCMATGANAAVYDWSYVFGTGSDAPGTSVYGSFEGTEDINTGVISGLSNITMGTVGTGTGPTYYWDSFGSTAATCVLPSACTASLSGLVDIQFVVGLFNFNFQRGTDSDTATAFLGFDSWRDTSATGWSLTEQPQRQPPGPIPSVPESSSIYLLALGLFGLFGAARRKV